MDERLATAIERAEKFTGSDCKNYTRDYLESILIPLLSERKSRETNPGVWDGAAEWADMVSLTYKRKDGRPHPFFGPTVYTRELPKTKAREIAERAASGIMDGERYVTLDKDELPNLIEAAINEALCIGGEK